MRTLLILVFIYLLFRTFARIIFPFVVKSLVNKASEQMGQQGNTTQSRREGEVHVDFQPPKKSSNLKDKGEYVDYEEVK